MGNRWISTWKGERQQQFTERLTEAMRSRYVTMAGLARRSGASQPLVSNYCRGKAVAGPDKGEVGVTAPEVYQ